jgi:hypothetical protein
MHPEAMAKIRMAPGLNSSSGMSSEHRAKLVALLHVQGAQHASETCCWTPAIPGSQCMVHQHASICRNSFCHRLLLQQHRRTPLELSRNICIPHGAVLSLPEISLLLRLLWRQRHALRRGT